MSDEVLSGGDNLRMEDDLPDLVTKLRTAQGTVNGLYTQAEAAGGALPGVWGGQAGAAAAGLQNKASDALRELRDSIGVIAELLEMSINGFNDQEMERVRELSGVESNFDNMPATRINGF